MKKYLLYALAGVLLTACGKEELPESGPNSPEGGVRSVSRSASRLKAGARQALRPV